MEIYGGIYTHARTYNLKSNGIEQSLCLAYGIQLWYTIIPFFVSSRTAALSCRQLAVVTTAKKEEMHEFCRCILISPFSIGRPLYIKILSLSFAIIRSQAPEFESPCTKGHMGWIKTFCYTTPNQHRKTFKAKRDMFDLSFMINIFKLKVHIGSAGFHLMILNQPY